MSRSYKKKMIEDQDTSDRRRKAKNREEARAAKKAEQYAWIQKIDEKESMDDRVGKGNSR